MLEQVIFLVLTPVDPLPDRSDGLPVEPVEYAEPQETLEIQDPPNIASEVREAAPLRRIQPGPNPPKGFRDRGGLLLVSVGGGSPVDLNLAMFRWGLSMGAFRPSQKSGFAASYSFFFDHFRRHQSFEVPGVDPITLVPSSSRAEVNTNLFHLGVEARFGGSREGVFGYGLVGLGVSLLYVTSTHLGKAHEDSMIGVPIPLGGGVQALLADHFIAGVEARIVPDFRMDAVVDVFLILGGKW